MTPKKVVIVGAGIAGIAASIRMAVKGYVVDVYEANAAPGGKLAQIQAAGFRFDAGPSLFTMPHYVEELFELAGKDPKAYFNYLKPEVVCNYFYADGTSLSAYADAQQFAQEIANKTNEPIANVLKHMGYSKDIYLITHQVFLEKSLHRLKTWLSAVTFKSMLQFLKIDSMRTMHRANKSFFRDERVVQLFDRYATYNGSNPYQAPATLNVIPHLEQHFGAYFPVDGMYSIVSALVKLAEELGVSFHYNSPVEEIILEKHQAKGIKLKDKVVFADVVISNMDVWFTYKKLLSKHSHLQPKRILNQERSSSALVFYWGIKKQFPQLDLHNIFFSADYHAEFDTLWQQKSISTDPTVYINISSKYKPDDAPPDCENWFVMVNAPANCGQDWDKLVTQTKKAILEKLSDSLGEDISNVIISETTLDPRSIEANTSSYQGSIYGTSSNNRFAAFLRHTNRSSKIKNLYFSGGSVHPGGGIPLCLLSAKIVSDWII
jgi:phytoene desaturase